MRVYVICSAVCLALAAIPRKMTEAIDDLSMALRKAWDGILALTKMLFAVRIERPVFAFADGIGLDPTPAHYDAPPQSHLRHESFTSQRGAPRGV